jgi:hypothetical protein
VVEQELRGGKQLQALPDGLSIHFELKLDGLWAVWQFRRAGGIARFSLALTVPR